MQAAKHLPDPLVDVPGLRQGVEPFEHQKAGAAIIKDSLNSPSQGIIVGDPPGLGKTLQVLMPIAATREPGDGPCVVVCPTSCVSQWKEEVPKFFYEVRQFEHSYIRLEQSMLTVERRAA